MKKKLHSFPILTTFKKLIYQKILGIRWERPLDTFAYNYGQAREELTKNLIIGHTNTNTMNLFLQGFIKNTSF